MKIRNLIISLCLLFVVGLVPAHAVIKQVTSVSASASTILTPGPNIRTLVIQNNGSGGVRLAIDGGTVSGLTDPTASTGYLLPAGQQVILTYPGDKRQPVIRAILTSGTTTVIDLVTDDASST